jgi:2-polyprenyl-6-methoxyphenol hydroxylase-like FAD-dependent oxidoreductase
VGASGEVPVLIVGGGPVGTTAAILLARQGVASLVVERRASVQPAPAAHVVNARTLEILRAAGVDRAAIAAACQDPSDAGRVRFVMTLAGEELGSLPFERQGEDVLALTPTPLRNLSQHRLEPILVDHLRKQAGASLRTAHEWVAAEQDDRGVTSRIRDLDTGRSFEVRSRWLLAADGAGSRVRKALGIDPIGPPRLASFVMIHFEARLRPLVGGRPGVLYFTYDPTARGVFVAHDVDSTWVFMQPWDPERESPDDYTEERCAAIVRRAMGTSAVDFAIRTLSTWHMSAQVAERYREGRAFLVGDAAHRFPPTGGLGLNTGVQDAHNLAWKLAAVEAGWAPADLLDSYEVERRPVARENADVSARNAAQMLEVVRALGPAGDGERGDVRAAIANQAEHFDMLGLQLGFQYERGALVPDGSARPAVGNPVREFVPCGRPGARLPHAWTVRGGERVSTLDLLPPDRFTLIAGPAGAAWVEAAAAISTPPAAAAISTPPLHVLAIGRDVADPGGAWLALLGIGNEGALLVRPDQHVAWRSARGAANPRDALRSALARSVGL